MNKSMKVLVTGATGMLGSSLLKELSHENYNIFAFSGKQNSSYPSLDITNFYKTTQTIKDIKPDIVIHLAAKTNVDVCELEQENTYLVNTEATKNIATVCKQTDAALYFISTGAVFSGRKGSVYTENDTPEPINIYGKSKFEAEEFVKTIPQTCILRAGWLIGGGKKDKKFVSMILDQLNNKKKTIYANNNIFGSPTMTEDFSKALVTLIKNKAQGTYHIVNQGVASRYDIAKEIIQIIGSTEVALEPVSFGYFKEIAKRPKMEGLNPQKAIENFKLILPHWKESLKKYLKSQSV